MEIVVLGGGVVGAYDLQNGMCIENGVLKKGSWFSVRITDGLAAKVGNNPWAVRDGYAPENGDWAALIAAGTKLEQIGNKLLLTVITDIAVPSYTHHGILIFNGMVGGQAQNIAVDWSLGNSVAHGASEFNPFNFTNLVRYYKYEDGVWVQDVKHHTFPFACS